LQAAGIPVRSRLATSQLTHPAVRSAVADSSEFAGRTGVRDWIAEVQFKLAEPDSSIDEDARTALERLVVATYEHMDSEPFATHQSLRLSLAGENSQGDGVELLTFHAAKGREWHTVVVAGLERGLVPHASADTPAALAEETRLLYVALTRATQSLHGTWAKTREGYRAGRKRSPLVDGMLTDTAPQAPPPPDIRRTPAPPDPLLVALQAWRSQRARAAAVHPSFIMSDQTVATLAAARPQTADELAVVASLSPSAMHHFGPQLLALLRPA
jgi:DNA helicase II / ATP-dependent DNA helicase PcrA